MLAYRSEQEFYSKGKRYKTKAEIAGFYLA